MTGLPEAEKGDRLSIVGGQLLVAIASISAKREGDRNSDKPVAVQNQREEPWER